MQYVPQSTFLKVATSAVKKAETSKKQADVNQAKTRIGRLTASKQKTALTERVKKVQGTIDIRSARSKVQTAEKNKTQGAIKSAQTAIKKLNKGKEKTSLQNLARQSQKTGRLSKESDRRQTKGEKSGSQTDKENKSGGSNRCQTAKSFQNENQLTETIKPYQGLTEKNDSSPERNRFFYFNIGSNKL
nr:hypothetical protein [Bacillus pumilus]